MAWALLALQGAAGAGPGNSALAGAPQSYGMAPSANVVEVGAPLARSPMRNGFIGFSFEYKAVPQYAGTDSSAINPVLVKLIANLVPGGHLVLRIGGDSTDRTWWPVDGMEQPLGVSYTLTPDWIAVLRKLVAETQARLILGINLEAGSTKLASTEAEALLDGLGRASIGAFEIGNEPEQYPWRWYVASDGTVVPGRPGSYDMNAYAGEFSRWANVLPGASLAGPATGSSSWLAVERMLRSGAPRLEEITYHRYALSDCNVTPGSPRYPSVAHLLSRRASRGFMRAAAPDIDRAHRDHLAFRVDELNGVTCQGEWGVSNTFASALWFLDTLFAMDRAGVDAVNIHMWPGADPNQLFTVSHGAGGWSADVRPSYYGALLFTRAAPAGSRLLEVQGGDKSLRAWATLGDDGRQRIVLINDALSQGRTIMVKPYRAASAPAELQRLQAPSAYATTGVTLNGTSFAHATSTGELTGSAPWVTVSAAQGAYRVTMPAASAAMLVIAP